MKDTGYSSRRIPCSGTARLSTGSIPGLKSEQAPGLISCSGSRYSGVPLHSFLVSGRGDRVASQRGRGRHAHPVAHREQAWGAPHPRRHRAEWRALYGIRAHRTGIPDSVLAPSAGAGGSRVPGGQESHARFERRQGEAADRGAG